MKQKWIIICLFILALLPKVNAQIRCYTEENRKLNSLEPNDLFEEWLMGKKKNLAYQFLRVEEVQQIPVVVHIIHNGENIGEGANISDEQILSQIQVINEDFRRNNPDNIDTPAEFLGVAADTEIEFVLAKQDPAGLPTNGIIRVNGEREFWNWSDQTIMKNQSYWPQEDYLNIWVADIEVNGENLLGYATFPITGLPGIPIENSPENDGVAIDYTVFGSEVYYPQGSYNNNYNQGRTLTHELGHFFGLRHIWGDTFNCTGTDYCDDTPNQDDSTGGCPSTIRESCGSNDMYMNYMDYTNDACMNIFTSDQKDRMITVLNNSPRRQNLSTSHALADPIITANDAGITRLIHPGIIACEGNIIPQIELRNYGSNDITEVQISFTIDNNIQETLTFNPTLNYLDTFIASFSSLTSIDGEYEFEIVSVNGSPDTNPLTNTVSKTVTVSNVVSVPYFEDFESGTSDWLILNNDNEIGWQRTNAPNSSSSNQAMRMEFYDYEVMGEVDYLIGPSFDLSTAESPFLSFEYTYRSYSGIENDALLVAAIPNCAFNISEVNSLQFDTLFYKNGPDLSTVNPSFSGYYIPNGPNDWSLESFISLDAYKGQNHVQIVFIATNGYGNNLFVDNISIITESNLDLSINGISNPGRITCESELTPSIGITNSGSDPINSFELEYTLNNGQTFSLLYSSLSLMAGQSLTALLNPATVSQTNNILAVEITSINGTQDDNPTNNVLNYSFVYDPEVALPPDRENFNTLSAITWSSFSDEASLNWSPYEGSVRVESYNNFNLGNESWLFSQAYDFSNLDEAGLFFDLAYSNLSAGSESLFFLASKNCGTSFEEVLYVKTGDNLATTTPVTNFVPASDDWEQEYISLSDLAGESNVRLAFLAINGGGNNLYLDNIELFVEDEDDPLLIEEPISSIYPNPTRTGIANLTFNLPTKEYVTIRITDRMGNSVYKGVLSNALNQTIELNLKYEAQGLYIVEIIGETFATTHRLVSAR